MIHSVMRDAITDRDQPAFHPAPTVLEGEVVRLEPLAAEHASDLAVAGRDPAMWAHLPRAAFMSETDTAGWIADALREVVAGEAVVFAIVHQASGRAIGSTRYMAIRRPHRGLEIGWTWIATEHQRTAVNTACKLLLLRHAFEQLGAVRVELKTDERNVRSQRAIERMGGQREGVYRRHMCRPDGSFRNTVGYAIIDRDWPTVEARLVAFLRDRRGHPRRG